MYLFSIIAKTRGEKNDFLTPGKIFSESGREKSVRTDQGSPGGTGRGSRINHINAGVLEVYTVILSNETATTHLFSACDKYFSFEASIVLCWSLLFPVCFLSEAVAVTTKILRLGTSLHLRSLHCSLLGFFCFRSVPFRKPLPQLLKIIAEGNNASPSKLYRFSAGTFCFRSVPPREPLPQLHQFIARNNASSSKLL